MYLYSNLIDISLISRKENVNSQSWSRLGFEPATSLSPVPQSNHYITMNPSDDQYYMMINSLSYFYKPFKYILDPRKNMKLSHPIFHLPSSFNVYSQC